MRHRGSSARAEVRVSGRGPGRGPPCAGTSLGFAPGIWKHGVVQVSDPPHKSPLQRWLQVGIPVAVGVLVVVLVWLAGPGMLGIRAKSPGAPVDAQITKAVDCSVAGAAEPVSFQLGGKPRQGTLDSCGHGKDEHLQVLVPDDAPADGIVPVTMPDTTAGAQDLRAPIALALLVFACFCGGMYAYLVIRGPGKLALLS